MSIGLDEVNLVEIIKLMYKAGFKSEHLLLR